MTVAQRNNVKVAIAHQRRFNSAWTDARQLIAEGAIGEPKQIVCRGGQGLLNDCSHLFDMMRYVLSDPRAEWVIGNVERKTERYERETPIEDRSAGIIDLSEQRVRLLNDRVIDWEDRPSDGSDQHIAQARELVDWIEDRTVRRAS